jgi:predicted Zn-dependent peptidase
MPGRRTATAGIWVTHGAAHDPAHLAGATHLLEHLTLRRCGDYDRASLARLVDRLGGIVDAWTSVELMGVTAQTTADAVPEALSLLCDALLRPTFDRDDVALERRIAQAELELIQDDPSEQAEEGLLRAAWGDHPLARPVIGSSATLRRLGPRVLQRHHEAIVQPGKILAAVVGDIDPEQVEACLGELPLATPAEQAMLPEIAWSGRQTTIERAGVDQVHVRLAFAAVPAGAPEVPALTLLNRLLGVGASSRLFQQLREEAGLTYDIWSGLALRRQGGLLEVGWACSPDVYAESRRLVLEELKRLPGTIDEEEVEVSREAHVRALQIDSDNPAALCALDVAEHLERNRRFDLDQMIEEISAVTVDNVRDLATRLVRTESMAMTVCGPQGLAAKVA